MTQLIDPFKVEKQSGTLQDPFKIEAQEKSGGLEFQELADDYNVLEKGMINMGYGFDRAFSGAKQSSLWAAEKLGIETDESFEEYTSKKNQEYADFENDVIANGAYATTMQLGGEIAPSMAVPAIGAVSKLSILGKVGVSAVTGSAFGHAVYADSMDDKLNNTLVGATIGGSIPVLAKTASKGLGYVNKKRKIAKAAKIQEKAQNIYAAAKESGESLTKVAAIKKAIAQIDPEKKAIRHLEKFSKYMNDDSIAMAVNKNEVPTWGSRIGGFVNETAETTARKFNDITQPVSSTLREMGLTNVATKLNKHDMNLSTDLFNKLKVKDKFSKEFSKLTKNEQSTLAIHLNNGSFEKIQNQYSDDLIESVRGVRTMLDDVANQADNAGIEFGKQPNYFPREFDYKKLAQDNGLSLSRAFEVYAKAINKKFKLPPDSAIKGKNLTEPLIKKYLTEKEISHALADEIINKTTTRPLSVITSNLKSRTVKTVTPENMKYYSDPRQALTNYINRITVKIHDRNFFGGKGIDQFKQQAGDQLTDDNVIAAFIDDYAEQLRKSNSLLEKDADQFIDILKARFTGSAKPINKYIAGTKNILYSATLGNPMAAATQLGDLGNAAYLNRSIVPVIKSIAQVATRKAAINMDDFGLDAISHEFEHLSSTAKILDWSLKWGGFKAVDRLGKETILNSTFSKLKSVANPKVIATPKGYAKAYKYFHNRFGGRIDEKEIDAMIQGFAKGDKADPAVRLALFSDITKVQPISLSEMPKTYLEHPNGRIFYMLKTFMLKQLDLLRNDVINNVTKGVAKGDAKMTATGVKNMAYLAGTVGLANAGVEQARNWLSGKDVEFSDQFVVNLMRNYGVSEYSLDIIKQGKPLEAAFRMALPPVSVIEDPIRSVVSGFEDDRGLRSVPIVGRLARTWMHRDDSDYDLDLNLDLQALEE